MARADQQPEPSPSERKRIDDRNDRNGRSAEAALQRDADDVAPGLAVGVITGPQARGVVAFGAIGLMVGLVIGGLVALIPIADWSYLARLALFGGIGAFGGLIAGAVYGGGREPEIEGDVDNHLEVDGQRDPGDRSDPAVRQQPQGLRTPHIDEDMAHRIEEARHLKH